MRFEKVTHMLMYEIFTLKYIVEYLVHASVFHMYNFLICVPLSMF
jgi:hypothetical protein